MQQTLNTLRAAVQACRACDLYWHATQAVMGAGPKSASIVFVELVADLKRVKRKMQTLQGETRRTRAGSTLR